MVVCQVEDYLQMKMIQSPVTWYTGASYICVTNGLKCTSKIRMIKLENVHKFCMKTYEIRYIYW